jgi:hypothetical protein
MIVWIPQLIRCGIHMIMKIPHDHAALRARAPRGSPRRALMVTTVTTVTTVATVTTVTT